MLPYYDEVNTKVLTEICDNFVRLGDTVHLISFNEKPGTEISQPVKTEADIYKLIYRFFNGFAHRSVVPFYSFDIKLNSKQFCFREFIYFCHSLYPNVAVTAKGLTAIIGPHEKVREEK